MQRSRGKPARMRVWHPRAPALREKTASLHRRARACPSPCPDPIKDRSSGAPNPEWVDEKNAPGYRRERACSSPCNDRGGQAPALREKTAAPHRRARACPSPCLDPIKDRSSGAPAPERVKIRRSCPTEWGSIGRRDLPVSMQPQCIAHRNRENPLHRKKYRLILTHPKTKSSNLMQQS